MSDRASASSKMDLPLDKTEPISNSGLTSGITELRREKKKIQKNPPAQLQLKRGLRLCGRNSLTGQRRKRAGGAPGARAEVPLQPMEQTMVGQAVPCSHAGPWCRSPPEARGCPKEAVTPWGAHTEAGSWQDLWPCGERSPCRSKFAGRAGDPVGDPCWSSS